MDCKKASSGAENRSVNNQQHGDSSLYRGDPFLFHRKLRSHEIKTLREMRIRAKRKLVAKVTVLGTRVPQAELLVLEVL